MLTSATPDLPMIMGDDGSTKLLAPDPDQHEEDEMRRIQPD